MKVDLSRPITVRHAIRQMQQRGSINLSLRVSIVALDQGVHEAPRVLTRAPVEDG